MTQLKMAVAGVAGRMGRQLAAMVIDRGYVLTGGSEVAAAGVFDEDIGMLAGRPTLGVLPAPDAAQAAAGADVWIDFSRPEATLASLGALQTTSVRTVIIGTTGFSLEQESAIKAAATRFAIVKAGNFSVGINLLQALTRLAASRLGPDWDIEILESHHRLKVDAPSGTALMLGEAAAGGRGGALSELQAPPYIGPDAARKEGEIGMAVRRAGGIYGEHEVLFGSSRETVRLSHMALDRSVFAEGAVHAAVWAAGQPPGLYGMDDVLGIRHTG
ncbi:4-hydroxy-tetrahydrodipicolinate reductase [Hyphomonas sp.]|uniref:4-hydroxy-tetrahydrodipicolinate reductase n=1 Tax=Hyphomonas sp. TaxID=87 RepID=UPI003342D2EC